MARDGGGGGGGKDVRAGGAFFELFAKDKLTGVLDKLQRRALQFSAFMSKIGKASLVAGAGLAAPLAALFKGGFDRATEAAKLSAQLGVPVELMSKIQYAAEQAGVSVDEVMRDTEGRFSKLIASAPSIDPARAQQALETQRAFGEATDALQQAMLPLLDTVTPLVKMVAEFVKENANTIRVLVPVAAGLVAFGIAAKLTAIGVTALVLAVKAVVFVVGVLANPITLVTAALVGLGYVLVTCTDEGQQLVDFVKNGLVGALDTLKSTFQGVGDALAKGDFALAGKVAFAGLKVLWLDLVHSLTLTWAAFKTVFVEGWHDAVTSVALTLNDLMSWVNKAFTSMGAFIYNVFRGIEVAALEAAITAAEAARKIDPTGAAKDVSEWATRARDAAKGAMRDAEAEKAAIEAGRKGVEDILKGDAEREKKDRERERAKDVVAAADDVAKAKAELDKLKAEAAVPKPAAVPKAADLSKQFQLAEAVKGTFSGSALGLQFGVGDKALKQIELLKQIVNGDGKLPDRIATAVALGMSIR